MVSEEAMREALEGQFTTYVGNPNYDDKRVLKRELLKQKIREREAKTEAERKAVIERDLEAARKASLHHIEYDHRLILAVVAKAHGIPIGSMLGASRVRKVMMARHHATWELKHRKPSMSKSKIGYLLHRDHSTVINSIEYVDAHPSEFATAKEIVQRLLTEQGN